MAYKDIISGHNQRIDAMTEWTGADPDKVTKLLVTGPITKIDLPEQSLIARYAFYGRSQLVTVIIRNSTDICTLRNSDAFTGTPIASGTGYIYVPAALLDAYKAGSNWSKYANQFRSIEDYPDICGG